MLAAPLTSALLTPLLLPPPTNPLTPPASSRRALCLRGGATTSFGSAAAAPTDDELEAMRREYERYRAAVEMPLHNVDEPTAQRTRAVRVRGLLSREDIDAVHRVGRALAAERPASTTDRSGWGQPCGTWLTTFLNTEGVFEARLPELYRRVRDAAIVVDRDHWKVAEHVEHVNFRVVEYHTMRSTLAGEPTRGGLHTVRHCDQGSLVTIDILLTDPAEIDGGVLQTLEADGELLSHEWEQGDALVFLSHKYHCVSELTRGTRNVMVCELWQGTENHTPSRDEKERWQGEWKDEWRHV
mmetsp:Transcript_42230/g.105041  ORF Transcript_42230/g.105041 Transcript_42230/m.105041 type:complete len:298 (-) Transcript_42230:1955-2848(-)